MIEFILTLLNIFMVLPIYIYTTKKCFNKDTKMSAFINLIISPSALYLYTLIVQVAAYAIIPDGFRPAVEYFTIFVFAIIFMNIYSVINKCKCNSMAYFVYNSFILVQFTLTSCVNPNDFWLMLFSTLFLPIIIIHGYYQVVVVKISDIVDKLEKKQIWQMNLLPVAAEAILITNIYISDHSDTSIEHQIAFLVISYLILVFDFLVFNMVIDNTKQKIEVAELNKEIMETQESIIVALAEAIEGKSEETGTHVKNVAAYTAVLAREMGYSEKEVKDISMASMLHDVGKIAVPDEILNKPGKLTNEEFDEIKKHVKTGEKIIHNMKGPLMETAKIIALEHHEKWNGSGYLNKKPEETHEISRIVALADVWDALCSPRVYKQPWDREKAKKLIIDEKGKQFDPKVVDAFVNRYDEFCKILDDVNE